MKFTPIKKSSAPWVYKARSGASGGYRDDVLDLTRQITNYQERLGMAGQAVPTPDVDDNLVMKGLGLLDKPREMVWRGISGREDLDSGKEVIDNWFGQQDSDAGALEKTARFVGALGLEVVGDPLTYMTFGTGSLLKGGLRGAAKSMAPDVAQGLAKNAMGELTEKAVWQGTEEFMLKASRELAPALSKTELQTEAARKLAPLMDDLMTFDDKPFRAAINAKDRRSAIEKLITDGRLSGDVDTVLTRLQGLSPSQQKSALTEMGRMDVRRGREFLTERLGDDFLKKGNHAFTDDELNQAAQQMLELAARGDISSADKALKITDALPAGKKLLRNEAQQILAEKRQVRNEFLRKNYARDYGDEFNKLSTAEQEAIRRNRALKQAEYSQSLAIKTFDGTQHQDMVEEVIKKLQNPAHPSDVLGRIEDSLVKHYMGVQGKLAEQATGLSFGIGKHKLTLMSGADLELAGERFANNVIFKNPALAGMRDGLRSMFSTKYIKGVSKASQEAFSTLNGLTKGNLRVALIKSKEAFDNYNKVFDTMPDGQLQRELLTEYIEAGLDMPGYRRNLMRDETVEAAERMKTEFKDWLEIERRAGFKKKNVFTDEHYMPHMLSHELDKDIYQRKSAAIGDTLYVTDPTKRRTIKTTIPLANIMRNFDTSSDAAKDAFASYLFDLSKEIDAVGDAHVLKGLLKEENALKVSKWKPGNPIPVRAEVLKYINDAHELAEFSAKSGIKTSLEADDALVKMAAGETLPFAEDELLYFKKKADELYGGNFDVEDPVKLLDGVTNYYERDGVKAYISRRLQSNQLLYKRESVNNFLNVFSQRIAPGVLKADGTKYTIDEARETINEYLMDKDMAVVIRDLPQLYSVNAVDAVEGTAQGMTDSTAATLEGIYRKAQANGGMAELTAGEAAIWFAKKNSPWAAEIMPRSAYDEFVKNANRQVDDGISNYRKYMAAVHRAWKPLVTALRPDYHIRNLVGSEVQNLQSIGLKTFSPEVNWTAGRLLTGHAGADELVTLAGQAVPMQKLQRGLLASGTEISMMRDDLDMVENVLRGMKKDKRNLYQKTTDKMRDFGAAIEDRVRAVNFVANTEKFMKAGLSLDDAMRAAGDEVKKYHFDYSDLTEFEKSLKDTLVPFYTWSRKNIPLQLELALNEPRRYVALYRAQDIANQQFLEDEESGNLGELLPQWAKNNFDMATPFTSSRGNPVFLSGLFPQSDLTRFGKGPAGMLMDGLTMLGPVQKTVLESALNRSLLTGKPISEYGDPQDYLNNVVGQLGIVRNIGGALTEQPYGAYSGANRSPLALGVGNSMLKELDTDKALENAFYAYLRKLRNEVQRLQDEGVEIPTLR